MSLLISQPQVGRDACLVATRLREPLVSSEKMLPGTPNEPFLTQSKSKEYQSSIEISIDVFKAKKESLLNSLKDFLTCLPNPKVIETVLAIAIYRLAEIDPETCRWILKHPHYLMPELDLVAFAAQVAAVKLESYGLSQERALRLEGSRKFHISKAAKEILCKGDNCAGERLLFEEILKLDCRADSYDRDRLTE